ncbi:MAG: hypothetical protein O9282_13165 [Flavobacterium sp.]|jgi:hypothetical protein|uniref:hypothetical protein n=1 Tax=Flavobacterium sp. TaxID=239 RepID=UPI0022C61497|nr:hypothetical protein [Flavobacterium sp.]MCZ8023355.1 hypothetical protein [Cytophagales bacterium]MCZ8332255.1 hypothetical protein [Flavobacterium sp.]
MKKFDLPPGFYKIQKSVYNAYGAKHSRSNHNEIKLLRVVGNGSAKRYYINEDLMGKSPSEMPELNDYEIISEYAGMPTFRNRALRLEFEDNSGIKFKFSIQSVNQLKSLVQLFFSKNFS